MAAHPDRHCHAFKLLQASGQIPEAVRTGSPLARHQVDRRILASSIDLDIEFEPVAFSQFFHAGILDRADVDESVGLTIVARDEAKALHAVEELDRTSRALTRQLALRSSFALLHGNDIAKRNQITRRNLATPVNQGEFQLLTFAQTFETSPFNCADVDENVFTAIILLDEAKTLVRVEELHRALALANDLSRHAAATRAAAKAATAATAGATRAAAKAAAAARSTRAATEAATVTTAEAAATTAAAAAEPVSTAAETVTAPSEWIERFFSETVSLVAPPAATTSVKTHKTQDTLRFAQPNLSWRRGRNPPDNE
jgi:hypothetical protein